MKVYYNLKTDEIILVTFYSYGKTYIYTDGVLSVSIKKSPKSSELVYIGEFYSGDLYEME